MGNTFGQLFRVTTWGESHGAAIGAVIDGCPPRLALSEADIQPDLDRRRPGQSLLTSQRKESDTVRILSGVFEGQTLGTPISARDPERGHAPRRLPRDAGEVPAEPRRLHLRREVRHPRLARRRPDERARDGRRASRPARSRASCSACAGASRSSPGSRRSAGSVAECDVERVTREEVERTPIRCPDPADGRAHDRGRRGGAQGRRTRSAASSRARCAAARPAGASRSSTGSRPTSPRR